MMRLLTIREEAKFSIYFEDCEEEKKWDKKYDLTRYLTILKRFE